MSDWVSESIDVGLALGLLAVNGFFVAAEFALVKVRPSQLEQAVRDGRPFARTARWLQRRLDASLAACQLGITMASLALGWIGEPAVAAVLEPLFTALGVESPALLHGLSFAVAFSLISGLHLTAGEQIPKILAIRRAERLALWCAPMLKTFYVTVYPLLALLNGVTRISLKWLGVEGGSEHDTPHSEDEIRALMRQAHLHGELTGSEHRLMNAVLEFDDMVCRRVILPRNEVEFFDVNASVDDCLAVAARTQHTRYPVCDGSLDKVLGVVHLKDLVGVGASQRGLREMMRPPRYIPETLPISRLLRHFQAIRQHLAFVLDEYGTVIGIVTLENVLEQIVGPVEDEFDDEEPAIVPQGDGEFIVLGGVLLTEIDRRLKLQLDSDSADTLSGLLAEVLQRIPEAGDEVSLPGATATVLETKAARATRVRLRLVPEDDDDPD